MQGKRSCPIFLSPTARRSKARKKRPPAAPRNALLRLLGVATHNPPPAQNLHEAGEAELRRLAALHAKFDNDILGRLDADLCLFDDSPKSQLLNRYEQAAERNLHKAIDTFMKLRKNPELDQAFRN